MMLLGMFFQERKCHQPLLCPSPRRRLGGRNEELQMEPEKTFPAFRTFPARMTGMRGTAVILDFHTHVGDIFPVYRNILINRSSPPPHYVMISSKSIEAPEHLFYRNRPPVLSWKGLKHIAITLIRRRQTIRGMVLPNLVKDMQSHDITTSVVLPIEYHDGHDRSTQLINACQTTKNLLPFCSVHPHDPTCIEKMHRYMQMGAKGLKLHPTFQQIRPAGRHATSLYQAYADYHRPLILHSGLTGREGRFRKHRTFSSLEYIAAIPAQFPDMPIVLAHSGISQYHDAIELAKRYHHVYLEVSGQPAHHIRQALETIGPKRILFGSDWPFWNQGFALHAVRQAVSNDQNAERYILGDNAAKLLGVWDKEQPKCTQQPDSNVI